MRAVEDAPDLYGPFQYLPWWVLGILLLFVIAALWAGALIITRARGVLEAPPPPPKRVDVRHLKQKYLDMIDEIATEEGEGQMTPRELSQRLSLVLRFFAHESTGVQAEVMTLADLQHAELPALHGAVANYYPASFMRTAKHDPGAAIALARRVVATWM